MEQLRLVGPKSLGVALLTSGFVGMVFTIQAGQGRMGGQFGQAWVVLEGEEREGDPSGRGADDWGKKRAAVAFA